MVSNPLMQECVWLDKSRVEAAERAFYEYQANKAAGPPTQSAAAAPAETKEQNENKGSSLAGEIARAREQIQKSLTSDSAAVLGVDAVVTSRLDVLALENKSLRQVTSDLQDIVKKLEERIKNLEVGRQSTPTTTPVTQTTAEPAKPASEDDDDFDPFADEEEDDEEAERVKDARIQEYQAKKAKKPQLIAKSSLVLDVKPWEDTTDMNEMERLVRSIAMDGLVWGASKFAPVGYGIRKLVITCVIEDDKVSTDDLEEKITAFEDHVQSMDIAAFNKV